MIWILIVCTYGWVMCGSLETYEYASKTDCYEARDVLLERPEDFSYVVCAPREELKDE